MVKPESIYEYLHVGVDPDLKHSHPEFLILQEQVSDINPQKQKAPPYHTNNL